MAFGRSSHRCKAGDRSTDWKSRPWGQGRTRLGQRGWRGEQGTRERSFRGPTPSGIRRSKRSVKSSTMRGPRGLASESWRRRCRTANDIRRWVGSHLSLLASENRTAYRGWLGRLRQAGTPVRATAVRRPESPSDVSAKAKIDANVGMPRPAGSGIPAVEVVASIVKAGAGSGNQVRAPQGGRTAARQWRGGVRVPGGAEHKDEERFDGSTRLDDAGGDASALRASPPFSNNTKQRRSAHCGSNSRPPPARKHRQGSRIDNNGNPGASIKD